MVAIFKVTSFLLYILCCFVRVVLKLRWPMALITSTRNPSEFASSPSSATSSARLPAIPCHGGGLGPRRTAQPRGVPAPLIVRKRCKGQLPFTVAGSLTPGASQSGLWDPLHHPGGSDAMPPAHQSNATSFLSFINDLTKWAVSGAVFAVLLVRRDLPVAWCVLGSIIASFLNKALKFIINEQRPANARKADPGMPSSHANSLAFLGVYTALALAQGSEPLSSGVVGAASILALSMFLTWLRVRLGYHTVPQVLVGYGLGAATALAWHHLGTRHALEALAARPGQRLVLYGCTAVAVALFALRNVMAWYKERQQSGEGGSGLAIAAVKAA